MSDHNTVGSSADISLIVPVFNEEEAIPIFYDRVVSVLGNMGVSYQILFVNDGSRDNTLSILIHLNNISDSVSFISLSRNFGKEIALSAGLDHVNGKCAIPIDVDLQDPPEVIEKLYAKWIEGYDVVCAKRNSRIEDPFFKRLTAKLFYSLFSTFAKFDFPSNTGDFRLIDRKVIEALKSIRENNRFMKGLFAWVGFKQISVNYDRPGRAIGETKWNYIKLLELAIEAITSFTVLPLRIASVLGFFVSIAAYLYGIYFLIETLLFGNDVAGYPSLVCIILFLGGMQLLCIGIIGEYLGKMYMESKKRPLYVVDQKSSNI